MRRGESASSFMLDSGSLQLPDDPKLIYNIAVCQHEMGDNDEALDALKWGESDIVYMVSRTDSQLCRWNPAISTPST